MSREYENKTDKHEQQIAQLTQHVTQLYAAVNALTERLDHSVHPAELKNGQGRIRQKTDR